MDIMIDLETMGNGPTAAIVAIGAVAFDAVSGDGVISEFYHGVSLESSMAVGGAVNADTIKWWLRQSDTARGAISGANTPLSEALHDLVHFFAEAPGARVWGNGATFDNVILSSAYAAAGIERPWPFWADRCYRTVKALRPDIALVRQGTHHNALDDAKSQALHLQAIYRAMKKGLQ